MPQFLVTAWDGTDPEAPARRAAARPAHLRNVAPMVERGELVVGGAVLDGSGGMVGSVCIVECADRAALDRWLEADPYVTGGVWQRVEVRPFRVAVERGGR
ncbi:YciI family protein [Roseomonas sp. NAR14]|uniref:YciI family protein n=1 Tax=Roseomonas acroporae TaxID=2937791 RepID=A0A9X1Y5J6_9PROT|nr:YciI family protein [Roseomonas acroporae]MCK8783502.1 YciI family protein [Roseomonas acroporae]